MNPAPPLIVTRPGTNGPAQLTFPYPAAQQYQVFSTTDPSLPFTPDSFTGKLLGPWFQVTNGGPARFYKVSATPMNSNDVLIANVLNRLTYGPTPEELDRIRAVGPQAYIDEQMAAETITDTINTDIALTNQPPVAPPLTNWIRVSDTGTASNTNLFLHLNAAGRVYIDDIRLVLGTNADTGPNLLVNGDFEEEGPLTNTWIVSSNYRGSVATNSPTVDGLAASGTNCLLVVGTSAGSGGGTSIQQVFSGTNYPNGTRFTLSFSYLPVASVGATNITLTVRLSGSDTIRNAVLPWLGPTPPTAPPAIATTYNRLANTNATLDDLRSWHIYRAIHSPRQLHEVLSQFFQNHLTTQYQKTKDYFDGNFNAGIYTNDSVRQNISADLHWREHSRIRQALLNPNCTFHDLLQISIESPAMVIYLDTILNTRTAPNENYAREILELHTMGADNGYIQQDIVDLAKVWTGWQVRKKDASVADNPFAAYITGGSSNTAFNIANTPGIWTLHYNPGTHDSNAVKRLFTNNVIDPRFGAAFGGGTSYALIITNGAAAAGTNGFGEGYRVAQHLANLPYTMEFLSVKLCELFVHEGFEHGHYDYTAPDASPEALLVRDCMTAWNTPAPGDGRKGNIRSVLNVIFNSALFRGQGAAQQKVKTPLEYSVSAVRALRVVSTNGNGHVTSTSDSDGTGIITPLSRMGGMTLFNKAEPDGWSEKGSIWLNTANLCERMRYVQSYMMSSANGLKSADGSSGLRNTSDPVALLRLRQPGSLSDAAAVVDYFMGLLFPGEGAANLAIDREAAILHLNTAENGSSSPFNLLNTSSAAHDGRVRSMVGFLFSLPRFHEQ